MNISSASCGKMVSMYTTGVQGKMRDMRVEKTGRLMDSNFPNVVRTI